MNVMTQYRIKAESLDAQLATLTEFAEQLRKQNSPDIKFTAYQLPDKLTFRHVIYMKDEATAQQLMSQEFYQSLGKETLARCDIAPSFTPVEMVATFKAT